MGASRTDGDRGFSGDRKIAWEGFLHCQAALTQQLARELEEAGEIPLSTYDILVQLAESGGRLRLRDLVDRVVLSQPGLSRKVARLEEEGLLDRLPDPRDGRGVLVKISRSGRAALRSASAVHLSGIERCFAGRIDDDEAATLARVFDRLLTDSDQLNPGSIGPPPARSAARSPGGAGNKTAGDKTAGTKTGGTRTGGNAAGGEGSARGSVADGIPRQAARGSVLRRRASS